MDDDVIVLSGIPVRVEDRMGQKEDYVPPEDFVPFPCSECGMEMWFGPKQIAMSKDPDNKALCAACIIKLYDQAEEKPQIGLANLDNVFANVYPPDKVETLESLGLVSKPKEKKNIVACIPTKPADQRRLPAHLLPFVPYSGSIKGKCPLCEREIWIGPRQQKMVADGAEVSCMLCIREDIENYEAKTGEKAEFNIKSLGNPEKKSMRN
jgi:hypothetical protein